MGKFSLLCLAAGFGLLLPDLAYAQRSAAHGTKIRPMVTDFDDETTGNLNRNQRNSSTPTLKPRRSTSGRTDYTWRGGAGDKATHIRVNLTAQEVYVYSGETLLGKGPISSGKSGYSTPTGSFKVMNKSRNHRSNLYGSIVSSNGGVIDGDASSSQSRPSGSRFVGAPMPFFMRLTNGGVGFHAGFVTGRPASHGCIRLPYGLANDMFAAVPTGTPVVIEY